MASISSLTTISKASLAASSAILASPEQAFSLAVINAVNTLNSVMADLENHHASASAPTDKPAGQTWYDSTNTLWKGYKTLNGSPQTFWNHDTAYLRSAQTAGTATFKLGGPIDVNTTAVAGGNGVDLMTYSVPGSTLNADGAVLSGLAFVTQAAASAVPDWYFSTDIAEGGIGANYTDLMKKIFIIRTAAGTVKYGRVSLPNIDTGGGGPVDRVDSGSISVTLTSNQTLKLLGSTANPQQEIMLTRLLL